MFYLVVAEMLNAGADTAAELVRSPPAALASHVGTHLGPSYSTSCPAPCSCALAAEDGPHAWATSAILINKINV